MTAQEQLTRTLDDVAAGRLERTIMRNIERLPFSRTGEILNVWGQPGNVGNDGGGNANPHGKFVWTQSNTSGLAVGLNPALLSGGASDNFLFLLPLVQSKTARRYVVGFDDYSLPTPNDSKACQAREFQIEPIIDGKTFNGSWQIRNDGSLWYFHWLPNGKGNWLPASLPRVDTRKPLSLQAEFTCDLVAGTMTHRELWVNGVRNVLNIMQPAGMQNKNTNKTTVSFQLDGNSTADFYLTQIRGMYAAWM